MEMNVQYEGSAKWETIGSKFMKNPLSQEEPVRKEVIFTFADVRPIKRSRI